MKLFLGSDMPALGAFCRILLYAAHLLLAARPQLGSDVSGQLLFRAGPTECGFELGLGLWPEAPPQLTCSEVGFWLRAELKLYTIQGHFTSLT